MGINNSNPYFLKRAIQVYLEAIQVCEKVISIETNKCLTVNAPAKEKSEFIIRAMKEDISIYNSAIKTIKASEDYFDSILFTQGNGFI